MVAIPDIVDVTVSVSSSAVSRVGFNSLLILGKSTSFAAGWTASATYQVKEYTSLAAVTADTQITGAPLIAMLTAAFAQSPRVPKVYVGNGLLANVDAPATDLAQLQLLNPDWFGVAMETNSNAALQSAAPWCAANKKFGFFRLLSKSALPTSGADSNYVSVWWNSQVDYLEVAAASNILARTPGSYTAAFKTLEGIGTTTGLTSGEETSLKARGINWYPTVGGRKITYNGTVHNGATSGFIDTYIGALYLEARMEEDVYGTLVAAEKIPFTDDGINMVVNTIYSRLQQSVNEGYLAASPKPTVVAPTAASVSSVDRAARLLPNITFSAYTAGAIQKVLISGTVQV